MAGEENSQTLIDPRKMNMRDLAVRANLPVAPRPVEPPPHEVLNLGQLSAFTGVQHTELGEFISRKVEIYNSMVVAREFKESRAMTFKEYLYRVAHVRRGKNDWDEFDDADATKDFEGYLGYLLDHDPHLAAVLEAEMARPRHIQETPDRRAHTLVTGGSRSGKSELLKLLLHHYVRHPELGGVLLIDPHGELAGQVARWQEFAGEGAERLVYLDPALGELLGGGVPPLSPLQTAGLPANKRGTLAKQLATALTYFAEDGEGMTPQMERLASHTLTVLVDMEGGTLVDLWRGLTVPKKEKGAKSPDPPFVKKGLAHPNEIIRGFFANGWDGESYRGTRDALQRRLESYLVSPLFKQVMEAPQPLNLEALLNAGKVVVVNCAFEVKAGRALGRLLLAQIAAIGERRNESGENAPFHVFVDEATELMSPTFVQILERVGKRNIWLTMVQQQGGGGGDSAHANRIAINTHLKFLGRSGSSKELLRFVEMRRGEIPMLKQGEFIVAKSGEQKTPMLLRTPYPSPLAKNGNAMGEADFAAVMERQFATYYRKPPAGLSAPPPPAQGDKRGRRGDEWGEG